MRIEVLKMKFKYILSVFIVLSIFLCSCSQQEITGSDYSQNEGSSTTDAVDVAAQYNNSMDLINKKDWMAAYTLLLSIDENDITNNTSVTKEDIQSAINSCTNNFVLLGKSFYDNNDYLNAYQYWTISNKNESLDYSKEYDVCKMIYALQGTKFDRKNFDKTIFVEGTTVIVDSENEDIPIGHYNTKLGIHTNNSNEDEWVLFFDNNNYLLKLPKDPDSLVVLMDLNKEFPDNLNYYYSFEGAKKANEEGQKWKEYLAEQERIKNTPPHPGMSKSDVENGAWGKPQRINKTTYSWGVTEQWCYTQNRYVYFKNGIVVAVSE